MKVTLYSLPGSVCHQCRFTKKKFDQLDIPYVEVRVDLDGDALEHLRQSILDDPKAKLNMPVVQVDLGEGATWTWQGYRPSQIELLASQIAA